MAAAKPILKDIPNVMRVYKDGSVERFIGTPYEPPSLEHNPRSKDIDIRPISARLFLPGPPQPGTKLPVLVYYHGGGFCLESTFSSLYHFYLQSLALEARVLIVSIEYRRAPEHPLPIAYEDSWEALQWVASHSFRNEGEPWIFEHGDLNRPFIGGDSAGANIVHNIALRAGSENLAGNVRILGAFLGCPYFWGSNPIGNEKSEDHDKQVVQLIWDLVYPNAPHGIDNPMINPNSPAAEPGAMSRLGCSRMLVLIAGKDQFDLRDRGVWYVDLVRKSGWKGEVEELIIEEGEHAFHVADLQSHNSQIVMKHFVSFLNK